jgi:Terpene synthase family 2, C-terminal metal binding
MAIRPDYVENFKRNTLYENMCQLLRTQHSVALNLRDHFTGLEINLPINFGDFAIPKRVAMTSHRIFELVDSEVTSTLARYLRTGDFEFLAYYTCRNTDRLSDSLKRMDWFFYLDEQLDVVLTGKTERETCVKNLIQSLDQFQETPQKSRLHWECEPQPWIPIANTLLLELLDPIPSATADGVSPSPRSRVIDSVRDYYQGLLDEEDSGNLAWYLETRIRSIGVIPEIEFCFSYSNLTLDSVDALHAQVMARAVAVMILVQNDLVSAKKEKAGLGHGVHLGSIDSMDRPKPSNSQPQKLSLSSYASSVDDLCQLAERLYSSQFNLFHQLRPLDKETSLYSYWQCCNDWLCGSMVWHLLSPRYQYSSNCV